MIKTYCDVCGREAEIAYIMHVSVVTSYNLNRTHNMKPVDLCEDCKRKIFDVIEPEKALCKMLKEAINGD